MDYCVETPHSIDTYDGKYPTLAIRILSRMLLSEKCTRCFDDYTLIMQKLLFTFRNLCRVFTLWTEKTEKRSIPWCIQERRGWTRGGQVCVCVLIIRGHSLKQISAKGVMVPVIKVPSYILQGFSIVFKNHTTLVNE